MNTIIKQDHLDLELFKIIPINYLSNFMISLNGILYNINTKKYKIFSYNNKDKAYVIDINKKRFQAKYLLYITFIKYQINIKSKDIIIKEFTNNDYINFKVEHLELNLLLDNNINLNDFKPILINNLNNYLISKNGLIYNKNTNQYLKPYFHINTNLYVVNLKKIHYQLKHLLYFTFIDNTIDFDELRNVKSKFTINVKNINNDLPYINFTINDLELITKSEKNKLQFRNNRIINKYDINKQFIKSYDNIDDIREELNIKYNKYITLACNKSKDKPYHNYYF
jgi:hypothetical protein